MREQRRIIARQERTLQKLTNEIKEQSMMDGHSFVMDDIQTKNDFYNHICSIHVDLPCLHHS